MIDKINLHVEEDDHESRDRMYPLERKKGFGNTLSAEEIADALLMLIKDGQEIQAIISEEKTQAGNVKLLIVSRNKVSKESVGVSKPEKTELIQMKGAELSDRGHGIFILKGKSKSAIAGLMGLGSEITGSNYQELMDVLGKKGLTIRSVLPTSTNMYSAFEALILTEKSTEKL